MNRYDSEISLPGSREEIRQIQSERLVRLIDLVRRQNPFWQGRLADSPPVRSLDDLSSLPLTTKQDLVDDQNAHPPYGTNLTFDRTRYIRWHQTSGTTGRPMKWLDTEESWNWFLHCWQLIYDCVGITRDDVLAFPFSFGPFVGFWAAFDGSYHRGNLSLAMGGMSSEARLATIAEHRATVVCCTPTYGLRLAEIAAENDIDLAGGTVRALIVAGEPGGSIPATRKRLEEAWGARVFDHWGMTDIGSLGIEPEAAPGGLLLLDTECIAEILHPERHEPVAAGELGELVITNLGRTGQPVIRYRTGDLVQESKPPCPSGLPWRRLEGGILGRADDMITIRGNNVFPSSVEAILREFDAIAEYRIVVQDRRSMKHLRIDIETRAEFGDADCEPLIDRLRREMKDRLNFQAEIARVAGGSLPRFELKGRRLVREDTA